MTPGVNLIKLPLITREAKHNKLECFSSVEHFKPSLTLEGEAKCLSFKMANLLTSKYNTRIKLIVFGIHYRLLHNSANAEAKTYLEH
jgi:hypothetical protein